MGIRIVIHRGPSRPRSEWSGRLVWGAVLVALSGSAYAIFGDGGLVQVFRGRSEVEQLAEQVREAERLNAELRVEIDALQNDPAEIERVAREELLLARPDETVYVLPRLPDTDPDPAHRQRRPVPEDSR